MHRGECHSRCASSNNAFQRPTDSSGSELSIDPSPCESGESRSFPWESVRTVVDVGGGTGAMLAEILRARREVHGTLVDLPSAVARSGAIFQAAGVAKRVTTVG